MTKKLLGLFFIGFAVGQFIPQLGEPLSLINPYLGIIGLIAGVILLILR